MTDLLTTLLQRLDEPAARYAENERYYAGKQALAYLAPEAREALGDRFGLMSSNIPRLAITSLTERLRITGFSGVDVWDDWLRNDLDQQVTVAHREALLLGQSFVIVWADPAGRPRVSIESALQTTVLTDPGSREVVAACKRWETATTTEAVMYGPDEIVRYRANQTGATTAGFKVVERIPNPLGVVPVVPLTNSDRLLDEGVSEIEDLKPLVDALNKTLTDMLVTSEFVGRPRRWATGIELVETDDGEETSPIPEGDRAMVSESADTKFGQLEGADLGGYEAAVRILLGQIMAVSALPAHYIGQMSSTPPSADALRAAEASLTARAQARQQVFGRAWEQVARLIVAVRDGADPRRVEPRVVWADPATRSIGQEADAIVKLFSSGLLPADYALQRLGYGDDEIAKIRTARRTHALDTAGVDLSKLVN